MLQKMMDNPKAMVKANLILIPVSFAILFAIYKTQIEPSISAKSVPQVQQQREARPAPVQEDMPFSEADVAVGYKDYVNGRADTSGLGVYVMEMTCLHKEGNEYICSADWSNGTQLSASVVVSEDGSFVARDVQ